MMRGLEGFAQHAEGQARFFASRGIAVYARMTRDLARLAESDAVVHGALEEAWADRAFSAEYERPLLLLASLRMDALADPAHPLARALAADGEDDARVDDRALRAALEPGRPARGSLRARFVQTNEVSRAIAWRLPLAAWAGAPDVTIVDLGCSAGLNLVADRLDLAWRDGAGANILLAPTDGVVGRVGLDRSPVDVRRPSERAWLRACLWPGQKERDARLRGAMDEASRALDRGEMTLETVEAEAMPDVVEHHARRGHVLAYQTVFSAYLAPLARAAYEEKMHAVLARNPGRVTWAELEGAPKGRPGPAELRVHTAAGTRVAASCEYHPSTLLMGL
jgi:hypothetical protein